MCILGPPNQNTHLSLNRVILQTQHDIYVHFGSPKSQYIILFLYHVICHLHGQIFVCQQYLQ